MSNFRGGLAIDLMDVGAASGRPGRLPQRLDPLRHQVYTNFALLRSDSTLRRHYFAIHGSKPYKFIGFGDIHGPKPYRFTGFGDIHGPKPYFDIPVVNFRWKDPRQGAGYCLAPCLFPEQKNKNKQNTILTFLSLISGSNSLHVRVVRKVPRSWVKLGCFCRSSG